MRLSSGSKWRYGSVLIDEIADYIDEHGWVQDLYVNDDGCVCLDGAVRAITLGNPGRQFGKTLSQTMLYGEIADVLTHEINDTPSWRNRSQVDRFEQFRWYNLVSWNDISDMTEGRVIYLLRTVARKLRGGV